MSASNDEYQIQKMWDDAYPIKKGNGIEAEIIGGTGGSVFNDITEQGFIDWIKSYEKKINSTNEVEWHELPNGKEIWNHKKQINKPI